MKTCDSRNRSAALLLVIAGLAAFCLGGTLRAQAPSGPDTTSSTTEDSTGTVTAVSGTTISVTSRRGPFTYQLGPDVHIIGPENQHLQIADVRSGQEATVYYYQRDGQPTVARIVLLKEVTDGKKDH